MGEGTYMKFLAMKTSKQAVKEVGSMISGLKMPLQIL